MRFNVPCASVLFVRAASDVFVWPGDREKVAKVACSRTGAAHLKQRAKIVLLVSDGLQNIEIAEDLGVEEVTVRKWRGRYIDFGVDGLVDAPRPGRPAFTAEEHEAEIVQATITPPLNRTHWSVRAMAEHIGCTRGLVERVWKKHGLEPHKVRRFKISDNKQLEEKLEDVVGFHLSPPADAVVFSMDEKSQMQSLDRSKRILSIRRGLREHKAWDYRRHRPGNPRHS